MTTKGWPIAADAAERRQKSAARAERWARRLKFFATTALAIIAGLVLVGWRARAQLDGLATQHDVAKQERRIDDLDHRAIILETDERWIVRTLDAIADRVGAAHSNPPAPANGGTP